jgi:quercetin dioxygenase-like cupin family protein
MINMKKGSLDAVLWKDRFTYTKTIPLDENDLHCQGTKFQVVSFQPHTSLDSHYHKETYEIFYVKSGYGIIKLNEEEFRCQPDDFFLCEPWDVHEFINDRDEDFVLLIFKTNEVADKDIYWV